MTSLSPRDAEAKAKDERLNEAVDEQLLDCARCCKMLTPVLRSAHMCYTCTFVMRRLELQLVIDLVPSLGYS